MSEVPPSGVDQAPTGSTRFCFRSPHSHSLVFNQRHFARFRLSILPRTTSVQPLVSNSTHLISLTCASMVPPISIGRQSFPRYPLATARQHAATLQIESSLRLPISRPCRFIWFQYREIPKPVTYPTRSILKLPIMFLRNTTACWHSKQHPLRDAVRRLSYHRPRISAGAATVFPVRFKRTKLLCSLVLTLLLHG